MEGIGAAWAAFRAIISIRAERRKAAKRLMSNQLQAKYSDDQQSEREGRITQTLRYNDDGYVVARDLTIRQTKPATVILKSFNGTVSSA